MEGGTPEYLQPGDDVLLREGRHPLSILDEALALLVLVGLIVAGFVATFAFPAPARFVPLLMTGLTLAAAGVVLLGLVAWWRVVTSEYVLTSERVYASHGLLRYFLAQTTYDKVTDVHVRQSVFGRWAGFGTVRAETAGEGLHLVGVRDPFRVARELETARVGFIRDLVERHLASKRPARSAAVTFPGAPPAPRAAVPPTWTGRPAWVAFWLRAAPVAVIMLAFLGGSISLMMVEPRIGVAALIMVVLLLGATAAGLIIRQTTTRFEVYPWGVVVASGWLGRRRVETMFEKITDVTTTQGLVARLLDYGNLAINTAGSATAPILFFGVPRPDEVKGIIDAARSRRRAP